MSKTIAGWFLQGAVAAAICACAAAEPAAAPDGGSHAGWYSEHGAGQSFQRCGLAPARLQPESAELRAEAKKFGLEQDTPVYVRLNGTVSADGTQFSVSSVDQFGSAVPVRDCSMTGLQTQ